MLIICINICTEAQSFENYSRHESIGLSPTAFSLQKGEKRITNTAILVTNYTTGINDKLSISGGIALTGAGLVRLKYTHQLFDYVRIGISPALGRTLEEESYVQMRSDITGILTIGQPEYFLNFTYSRGFNFETRTRSFEIIGVGLVDAYNYISLGGNIKISNVFSLSTENFLEQKYSPTTAYSIMLRYNLKHNRQIKAGVYRITERHSDQGGNIIDYTTIWPAISFSVFWGRKNDVNPNFFNEINIKLDN